MNVIKAAEELNQLHVDNSRLLAQLGNSLSASGEAGVLLWLNSRAGKTFAVDIVEHFGLTPGRVANIIKMLEKRAYIERNPVADYRRKASITLTESGIKRANELYEEMNSNHIRILEKLGEEDAGHLMRIIKRIVSFANYGLDTQSFDI